MKWQEAMQKNEQGGWWAGVKEASIVYDKKFDSKGYVVHSFLDGPWFTH